VDNNRITPIEISTDWLETFPYWSPDGKSLYFAAAHFKPETENTERESIEKHASIRYNLVRKTFDASTRTFGKSDTVVNARSIGKSATFPRVSPDGQYMLFTMADYGNFHIWHRSSDLYLMDLKNNSVRNVEEINSPDVDSYHSWSSSGKWVVFSSRREDGGYTRLYLTYFDGKGGFSKPFILPQKDPSFYERSFKSFNVPEFIVNPAPMTKRGILNTLEESTLNAEL
jgi:Tol biopolymer transport system component